MNSTQKTPIISKPDNNIDNVPVATPWTVGLVNVLSYGRAFAGASCILAPTFTGKLFQIPIVANSTNGILLRLFGVRDAVIGELLWTVRPKLSNGSKPLFEKEAERRELRRILWANVATDALDVLCTGYALSRGALSRPAAACVGGGASVFLILGLLALKDV